MKKIHGKKLKKVLEQGYVQSPFHMLECHAGTVIHTNRPGIPLWRPLSLSYHLLYEFYNSVCGNSTAQFIEVERYDMPTILAKTVETNLYHATY